MMPEYAAAAVGAVIFCTGILLLIFIRLKLLNPITLLSIAFASLISITAFPFILGNLSQRKIFTAGLMQLLFVMALAVLSCLVIAFLFSIIITRIFPGIRNTSEAEDGELKSAENLAAAAVSENYLERIYDKLMYENERETLNNEEITDEAENNLEKSVDSNENIDKMGIENSMQDSTIMPIEGCIEEAFKLKDSGDAEGAIRYFTEALEKNPRKDLTFWIVLDICVLYKNLGQADLAYDILNSYYEAFGDIMDASVKEQIEFNLFDIYA